MASRKKIFIADDDVKTLELLEAILSAKGYELQQAEDGRTALERINAFLPDLIVIDIMMPDVDGPEVIKTIKQTADLQGVSVIFLSGIAASSGQPDILVDGQYYPVLGKPFDTEQLAAKVEELLQ